MITKCQFCDYQKESALSKKILNKLAEPDLPEEDYLLYMERLVRQHGRKDWVDVKMHMGLKHMDLIYIGVQPLVIPSSDEEILINFY